MRQLDSSFIYGDLALGLPGGSGINNLPSLQESQETQTGSMGGETPGGGQGNPLQCSCLENSTDGGACQATVHRVIKSQTGLNGLSTQACTYHYP